MKTNSEFPSSIKIPKESFSKNQNIFILVITGILLLSPLFYKLNEEPLKRWDESLYAMVAYELAYHGKSLLAWDDWRGQNYSLPVTKPKTLFWMQAGFMKLLGYDSKLAIRLPSVIASALLFIFIIGFFYKENKSVLLGVFICLVLVSIKSYMFHHVARSGDMDAFLLLFSTMALLYFYKFLNTDFDTKSYKYLYLACASMAGAVLFKDVAGLLILPGMLLYTLYKRKLIELFKMRHLYYGVGIFFLIITPYFLFEALTFPHYFHDLWVFDIGGRFATVLDENQHPFLFYFRLLFTTGNHMPWILFIPLSIVIVWGIKNNPFKELIIFSLIVFFSFTLFISFSKTKIAWYVAPVYPFLGIIAGVSIYYIFNGILMLTLKTGFAYKITLLTVFGIAIIFRPYMDIFQEIDSYKKYTNNCGFMYDVYEECFKKIQTENLNYKDITVFRDSTDWWIPQLRFYQNVYNDIYNFNIQISEDPQKLTNNQNIVICYAHMPLIENLYKYDILLRFREIQLIKIKEETH